MLVLIRWLNMNVAPFERTIREQPDRFPLASLQIHWSDLTKPQVPGATVAFSLLTAFLLPG